MATNENKIKLVIEISEEAYNIAQQRNDEILSWAELLIKNGTPLKQEPCEDWYDVPSDKMTLGQARQAVKDLRKKLMEYLEQEPTTKTCRTCKNFGTHHGICDICRDNKCWTEKEPSTKNDLVDDCIVDILGSYTDLDIPYKREIAENILTKLSSVTPQSCDAISRQEAIDTIRQLYLDLASQKAVIDILKVLPSVTPQETRKGCWEHGRELSRVFIGDALKGINYEDWHCSNCHCVIEQSIKPKWNYCPNCGAKMQEVEE